MEQRWINEKQVSEVTGIAVQTLRNWRQLRRGFPYSKVGRAVRYAVQDVMEFMEARRVNGEE
jgi:predicted DNA-binding transcriptional regulator AlpA